MSRLVRFAALALVFVPALALAQQGGGADLDWGALTKAKAGAWAEYSMTMKNAPPGPDGKPMGPMTMRYSLVEKTAKNMTIEIETATPMGPIQVQMKYVPSGADAWKVAAGKMRMGAQAMDLQPAQIAKSSPVSKDPKALGNFVGNESVTTPAGTFECRHYTKTVQDQAGASLVVDLWFSDKVAPVGMVKSVAKDKGIELLLAATGKDAVAKMK